MISKIVQRLEPQFLKDLAIDCFVYGSLVPY